MVAAEQTGALYATRKPPAKNPPARKPPAKAPTKPAPKKSTPPPTKKPFTPFRRGTRRLASGAAATAQRGARQQGKRATGGIGAVFVVLTGAGIMFAALRNPNIITAPIQFVTTVINGMTRAFTKISPVNVVRTATA